MQHQLPLAPYYTTYYRALHHPIRCSERNVSFSNFTAQIIILSILPLLSYTQKVRPLGCNFLWGQLLACEWGVLCVPPLS